MELPWRQILMAFVLLAGPVFLGPEPMDASETLVSITPGTYHVVPGTVFTVGVQASQAQNLAAFEFFLTFDPSVLRVIRVEAGDFLTSTGRQLVSLGPDIAVAQVGYGGATYGYDPGVDGEGLLARITFQAVGAGVSDLHFTRLILTDTDANVLPARTVDGQVTSSGEAYQVLLPLIMRIRGQ